MKYNIQWTNKYSYETGYVGKVMFKAGHFVNATAQEDAKKYVSVKAAENEIVKLNDMGEGNNNNFSVVPVA